MFELIDIAVSIPKAPDGLYCSYKIAHILRKGSKELISALESEVGTIKIIPDVYIPDNAAVVLKDGKITLILKFEE